MIEIALSLLSRFHFAKIQFEILNITMAKLY